MFQLLEIYSPYMYDILIRIKISSIIDEIYIYFIISINIEVNSFNKFV